MSSPFKKTPLNNYLIWLMVFLQALTLAGCFADRQFSYPHKKEKEELFAKDSILDHKGSEYLMRYFDTMRSGTTPLTLPERILETRPGRGGVIAPLVSKVLIDAANAVKTIINNEQNKYTTVSSFAKTDLYFYDQGSLTCPLDPAGMQFMGFDVVRFIKNDEGKTVDTAFIAEFQLDTAKIGEVYNNSVFRLVLKKFKVKYVKPKVAVLSAKKMSVEFNITFLGSFVNKEGNIFDSVVLGKFHCLIKDVSLEKNDSSFGACPKGKSEVSGKSFIIPRSFGYFKYDGKIYPGYNQGQYTIIASVKECTKPIYGNKIIAENSGILVSSLGQQLSTEATQKTAVHK